MSIEDRSSGDSAANGNGPQLPDTGLLDFGQSFPFIPVDSPEGTTGFLPELASMAAHDSLRRGIQVSRTRHESRVRDLGGPLTHLIEPFMTPRGTIGTRLVRYIGKDRRS